MCFFLFVSLHYIEASLIYSVVLVSAVQPSDSVICTFLCYILLFGAALSHGIQ